MQRISAMGPRICVRLLGSCVLGSWLACGDANHTDSRQETATMEDATVESSEASTSSGSSGNADASAGRADGAADSDGGSDNLRSDAGAAISSRDGGVSVTTDSGSSASPASDGGAGGANSDAGFSSAGCDRACLTDFNTRYLEALVAHDASKLPTSPDVRFTENGKQLPLTEGLWGVAKSLRSYRQDFAEVPAGQTAGFVALDDDKGVVLLAFRLKVVSRKVTEIETTVCRQGQATFFSPNNLTMRDPIYDMEVEPAKRLPRERMIEIVDLYFQALESGDGSKIPFDASASRNENGAVTASGSRISSVAQFSYIEKVERRYMIVDEERGNVLPWVLFQIPMGLGGSRTLHLAELFKVSGGKIMKIHAIMVNQPFGTPSGWE